MRTMSANSSLVAPWALLIGVSCATPSGVSGGHPQEVVSDQTQLPLERSVVEYDDGFRFRAPDGSSELVVEGLFQTVLGVFDEERSPSSNVELKRMRPELAGRVGDAMLFRLEPKFTEAEVELEEAWVGMELAGGRSRLMIGRMKAPFGLEEVRSRRHIDFPSFSLLTQFAPAEDHGVFALGKSESGAVEWGLAGYNGTGASDTTSSKDLAARLMVHPFANDEASVLSNLQVGLAGTYGRQRTGVGGETIDNEAGLPVMRFAEDVLLDGDRLRAGLELAWYHGPSMVQAEVVHIEQDMSSDAAPRASVEFDGAYVTLSRVLTGESKSFGGVDPTSPHDFKTHQGRGAWVLAARISTLRAADELEPLLETGTITDRVDSYSLGLNWVPNRHMIVRHSLIHSRYDDRIRMDSGETDSETTFLVEVQLHF